ncbi:MAG: DNA methyltransferase [Candidatus Omnitrophota bacterium]
MDAKNMITKQVWKIGDCIELLRELPDASIDLILADPPYGVDLDYGGCYIDTFDNWKLLMNAFIPEAKRVGKLVLLSTSKLEGEAFLFLNYMPLWRVCWYKGASCTRSAIGFKDWETIFVYGSPKKQTHDFFTAHANSIREEVIGHPCPKPLEWALWLIKHFSNEGDTILDPFLGSGTTLRACRETNRNGIGFELNPAYNEVIKKRLMSETPSLETWCSEQDVA